MHFYIIIKRIVYITIIKGNLTSNFAKYCNKSITKSTKNQLT